LGKKGYWLKADRYRMEWAWAVRVGEQMRKSLTIDDWANIAVLLVQIAQKLNSVEVPIRNKIGTPWVGAWEKLLATQKIPS
jgi:hypothetical protein